jgi:hypothetical protein
MPLATKNNAIILKDGKLAENCECCGEWYCVACETITSSGYSTTTFSDDCWGVYGSRSPLRFGTGYASRCVTINPFGDVTITISASLASKPQAGATFAVAIGSSSDSFSPFGGGGFRADAGFSIGVGQNGSDKAVSGWPGNPIEYGDASFSGTVSAVFSRRSGNWYVAFGSLPEVQITLDMPQQGYLFHGVTGTNEEKVFSSYSITVT